MMITKHDVQIVKRSKGLLKYLYKVFMVNTEIPQEQTVHYYATKMIDTNGFAVKGFYVISIELLGIVHTEK